MIIDESTEMTPEIWQALLNYAKKAKDRLLGATASVQTPTRQPGAMIFKSADDPDEWKWIGTFTNSFRDNDLTPEIFSSDANRRYVEKIDNGIKGLPELQLFHEPGWKIGKALFVALDEVELGINFVIAGGVIDKDKAHIAEALEKSGPWTMSHAVPEYSRNKHDASVFDDYWSDEVTVLPAGFEANPLTSFGVLGDDMIDPSKKKIMSETLGVSEDVLNDLERSNAAIAAKAKQDREYKSKANEQGELNMDEKIVEKDQETPAIEAEGTPVEATPVEEVVQAETEPVQENGIPSFDEQLLNSEFAVQFKSLTDRIGQLINTVDALASENVQQKDQISNLEKALGRHNEEQLKKERPQISNLFSGITKSIVGNPGAVDPATVTSTPEETPVSKSAPEETVKKQNPQYGDTLAGLINNGQKVTF